MRRISLYEALMREPKRSFSYTALGTIVLGGSAGLAALALGSGLIYVSVWVQNVIGLL